MGKDGNKITLQSAIASHDLDAVPIDLTKLALQQLFDVQGGRQTITGAKGCLR